MRNCRITCTKNNNMWDNVVIGKGDKGTSSVRCFKLKGEHSISDNNVSYWISDLMFGYGMTIFKDTIQGKKLTMMIDDGKPVNKILDFLNTTMFMKLSVNEVKVGIENIENDAYEKGRKKMQEDFKKLMGI